MRNSKCDKAYDAVTEGDEPQRVSKNKVFLSVLPY